MIPSAAPSTSNYARDTISTAEQIDTNKRSEEQISSNARPFSINIVRVVAKHGHHPVYRLLYLVKTSRTRRMSNLDSTLVPGFR